MQMQFKTFSQVLREPLFQLLVIGISLFVLYDWLQPDSSNTTLKNDAYSLTVTQAQVQQLFDRFSRTRGRQPNPEEQQAIIDDFVRESIYYREALALNLDKDDSVIRNRLRQKFAFLHEELSPIAEPSEQQLKSYFEAHKDQYQLPGTISFQQIYLGHQAETNAVSILKALEKGAEPEKYGEVTLLPGSMLDSTLSTVADRFGEQFVNAIENQLVGQWVGPINSTFGKHLVLVTHKENAVLPEFNQVSDKLLRDYMYEQRKLSQERFYEQLKQRYDISIQLPDKLSQKLGYQP